MASEGNDLARTARVLARAAAAAALLLPLLAHGKPFPNPVREASSPAQRIVDGFRAQRGAMDECTTEECFIQAFLACRPTHYTRTVKTVEGPLATGDMFVVKRANNCSVVTFSDFSDAPAAQCRIVMTVCPTFTSAMAATSRWTPGMGGCSQPEVLFTREVCMRPEDRLKALALGAVGLLALLGMVTFVVVAAARKMSLPAKARFAARQRIRGGLP